MFSWKDYKFRCYNFRLLLYISCLSVIGILVIGSATNYDGRETKQMICFLVGLAVMLFLSVVDYHFVLKFYWIFYLINLALLIVVEIIGRTSGGAQRWIPLGGIGIQPSELCKMLLTLFFAKFFQMFQEKVNSIKILGIAVLLFLMPLALVLHQPDLSSSIVIACLFASIVYVAGLSYLIIGGLCFVGVPVFAFLVYKILQPNQNIIIPYQKNRIFGFLYQNATAEEAAKRGLDLNLINSINYQQKNSVLAIGSGQLFGKGLANNTVASVKNGNFLSQPETDFIFAIVGEELGFVGSALVILLLLFIVLECLWVAKNAKDLSGKIIAAGMGAWIAFQSFFNIGVAIWILPNTGLPLPFVSYGMSSLFSLMIGIGVLLNVSIQRELTFKEVLYNDED
ncbi:MAG: FtsW/RodA/SpoVE family cell cycle protein [Lachnospiraceae bacterium]|nr:FtsW/RodA/SpoVE family cell cycle protein [Lachnospiraceae bacterium]